MANSIFMLPSGFTLVSGQTVTVGSGGAAASLGGTLNSQFAPVSNTSIGSQDVLYTYTLPASTLAVNGKGVRITAGGVFAATANAKSARVFFGATQLASTSNTVGSPNGTHWNIQAEVLRVTGTTQIATSILGVAATPFTSSASPAETLSGAVVITVTGLSATAAADVIAQLFVVEAI